MLNQVPRVQVPKNQGFEACAMKSGDEDSAFVIAEVKGEPLGSNSVDAGEARSRSRHRRSGGRTPLAELCRQGRKP